MNAIAQDRYGSADVLKLENIARPSIGDDEVLVRVRAASVNQADCYVMSGTPYVMRLMFGLRRPRDRVRGMDFAGVVESVGSHATRFQPGDAVYGEITAGSFAEYVAVPERLLSPKPENLTFEEAAAVPLAGTTALQGLRDVGKVQPGHKVLIVGASGGVGTFAVQIAKSLGADVTAVCSTRIIEMARSLGAERVIDYTREDVSQSEERFDVIFQVAGTDSPSTLRRLLAPDGVLVLSSGMGNRWIGPLGRILHGLVMNLFTRHSIRIHAASPDRDDLDSLGELIEKGDLTPVIDRTFPFHQTPDAIRYLQQGRARAKVVITH